MGRAVCTLFCADVATGACRTVRSFDHLIEAPNRAPDGSFVYTSAGRLYRFDEPSGLEQLLCGAEVGVCSNDHVLSPDGALLAVSCLCPDGAVRILVRDAVSGRAVRTLPHRDAFVHGFSPDGRRLVYCGVGRTAPGAGDICLCDVFGGAETVLTRGEGFNDGPEFSPDGESIWFNSTRTGRMQLFCMDPDGRNVRRVRRSGQNDWFAHFSPDGTAVAFLSYDEPPADPASHPPGKQVRLQLMDPGGQNLRTVARVLGGQGTLNVNSFSPDGSEFAFVGYASKAHLPRNLRPIKES